MGYCLSSGVIFSTPPSRMSTLPSYDLVLLAAIITLMYAIQGPCMKGTPEWQCNRPAAGLDWRAHKIASKPLLHVDGQACSRSDSSHRA
jgi:hypothetical protein